jgi:hypothetical protein
VGIHWYAESDALINIQQALDDVERRIFAPNATPATIDSGLAEREMLYRREDAARSAFMLEGRSVKWEATTRWPDSIRRHVSFFGSQPPTRSVLEVLDWGDDYYAENLTSAAPHLQGLSRSPFTFPRLSSQDARQLACELLDHVDEMPDEGSQRAIRTSALWLWVWASVGASFSCGQ